MTPASFPQFLPSLEHRGHISQAAKLDPSSKMYEVSEFGTCSKPVPNERELLNYLNWVSVLERFHADGLQIFCGCKSPFCLSIASRERSFEGQNCRQALQNTRKPLKKQVLDWSVAQQKSASWHVGGLGSIPSIARKDSVLWCF